MTATLTDRQLLALRILDAPVPGVLFTGAELLRRGATISRWATTQGVHQTMSSLVRKGFVEKQGRQTSGFIHYIITDAGRQAIA